MSQRMTAECVTAEQDDIDRKHNCADADPKMIIKPQRFPNVVSKNQNKNEREIEKVTVDVLHDERERTLAEISFPGLADGAGWRVRPERFVIRASIIIAGQPKSARRPQNQERRRIVDPT